MNYRLTIYPVMELRNNGHLVTTFNTQEELEAAKNTAADLLLYLQDHVAVMPEYSNMFISEQLVNGEWEELETED